jgi:hypothetical protein
MCYEGTECLFFLTSHAAEGTLSSRNNMKLVFMQELAQLTLYFYLALNWMYGRHGECKIDSQVFSYNVIYR